MSGPSPWNKSVSSAETFSAILQGVPAADESIFLVSKDGRKFAVQAQVLKASSDFFRATLENEMLESGKCLAYTLLEMISPAFLLACGSSFKHIKADLTDCDVLCAPQILEKFSASTSLPRFCALQWLRCNAHSPFFCSLRRIERVVSS